MMTLISPPKAIRITYDCACPTCRLYFAEQGISIEFADVREHPELILEYSRLGVNLTHDFVLDIDGTI